MGWASEKMGVDFWGRDVAGGITGQTGAEASMAGAQLQHDAAMAGIEVQKEGLANIRQDLNPFVNSGRGQLDNLNSFLNNDFNPTSGLVNPQNIQADPGYQFRLNQGFDQIQNSAAARGKLSSGGTLSALEDYRQGLNNTFVSQDTNRLMGLRDQGFRENMAMNSNRFNQLFDASRMGQNAAAQTGTAESGTANNITDLLGQSGNAMAAGGMGAAQSYGQGAQNAVGIAGGLLAAFSDERLKENVSRVGKMDDGTPIYTYSYKGDENKLMHMGVMAQEAKKNHPDAVMRDPKTNYLKVNYGAL